MEKTAAPPMDQILNASTSYWQSCALHAGVKLNIFTFIGALSLSAFEVAERAKSDVRGMTVLLNALTSMGFLVKEQDKYSNTADSASLLVKDSPQYIGYIIMHHHHLVDGWAQLDLAVKQGQPVKKRSYGEEWERECFLMGMYNLAMANAPGLAEEINLEGRQHLLDLGGGPGTYAIHFCKVNPELKATIFDRPTTRPFAMNIIKEFGMGDRIDFQSGDFAKDTISGSYDTVWLSHILHSNGTQTCQHIIDKTVSVLKPGGMIMIHEFFLNDTLDGPLFPALFSLNMLINNHGGRSYSETEIKEMLTKAGVKDILRIPYLGPNNSYVVCGTV